MLETCTVTVTRVLEKHMVKVEESNIAQENTSRVKKKMKMQREQENPTTSAIIETKYCTEIGKNHTLYLKIFT